MDRSMNGKRTPSPTPSRPQAVNAHNAISKAARVAVKAAMSKAEKVGTRAGEASSVAHKDAAKAVKGAAKDLRGNVLLGDKAKGISKLIKKLKASKLVKKAKKLASKDWKRAGKVAATSVRKK